MVIKALDPDPDEMNADPQPWPPLIGTLVGSPCRLSRVRWFRLFFLDGPSYVPFTKKCRVEKNRGVLVACGINIRDMWRVVSSPLGRLVADSSR
jgi:hypothetical protein